MIQARQYIAGSFLLAGLAALGAAGVGQTQALIGREISTPVHLGDEQLEDISITQLIAYGAHLFSAKWTSQEGEGRTQSKGNPSGSELSDPSSPLVFPRNFNSASGPDANSCSGCHNEPFQGGGGDHATSVLVLANRFDFVTFDQNDGVPLRGAVDERGLPVTLQNVGDSRKTIGMNGSGYIELLAREMTSQLQAIRDSITPGHQRSLVSKGVSFGILKHNMDGTWDTSGVNGLPAPSLISSSEEPPSLLILPFHQSGSDVSIRQFTNDAFNQHFGIQSEERVGVGEDRDQDGFVNELTTADVTAITLYQATLAVPGRMISDDATVRRAIHNGELLFTQIGCAACHVPKLPLSARQAIFSEPGPYNPPGNLQQGASSSIHVDLASSDLPSPRIKPDANGVIWVEAYTDMKLHDITSGPSDPNREPLDENQPPGSSAFFAGNSKFITRRLWGVGSSGPYMHHGDFTTMREATLAHSGEALSSRQAFQKLSPYDRDSVIEFLKSLQILRPGSSSLVVDARGHAVQWP